MQPDYILKKIHRRIFFILREEWRILLMYGGAETVMHSVVILPHIAKVSTPKWARQCPLNRSKKLWLFPFMTLRKNYRRNKCFSCERGHRTDLTWIWRRRCISPCYPTTVNMNKTCTGILNPNTVFDWEYVLACHLSEYEWHLSTVTWSKAFFKKTFARGDHVCFKVDVSSALFSVKAQH